MFGRFELQRWWKAVRAFGLVRGTSAFVFLVAPSLIRIAPDKMKALRIPGVPHPVWLRPATSDWYVMEQIFIDEEYSLSRWPEHANALRAQYESVLERGQVPVIVDCGAHIGLATLWFAQTFPRARIFAVEPTRQNFELLRQNVSSHPSITPVNAAIWDRETRVDLINANEQPWAWAMQESASGGIRTTTINDILQREPNGVPLLVKIDIEGGEVELFRSKTEWVERTPLIVLELHDWLGGWRGTGHAVFSRLSRHPRDYMQRGENIFSFAHVLSRPN
ncbi:MAG TPA: FkbM family methyltransferase [Pseudolabrys sp.]|jgi:FkbM family methyltransferase